MQSTVCAIFSLAPGKYQKMVFKLLFLLKICVSKIESRKQVVLIFGCRVFAVKLFSTELSTG